MDNLAGSGEESQKYERTIPKAFSSSLKLIKSHLFPLLIRIRAALDPLVQCAPPLTCFINLTMTNLQILLPFTLIETKDKGNTFFFSSQVWRGVSFASLDFVTHCNAIKCNLHHLFFTERMKIAICCTHRAYVQFANSLQIVAKCFHSVLKVVAMWGQSSP